MAVGKNRAWKCPVCSKDARKIMIDNQQTELLKKITTESIPKEVSFLKDGNIIFKLDNDSSSD
jgi:hypothetical protein